MSLKEFVKNNDVEYTKNLVGVDDISDIEETLGFSFGGELTKYILKYGYLAYKHIEFYGINSKQMSDSDMVKQSLYLHDYFPKTKDYIALENVGDGYYALVSENDDVYEYSSEEDSMRNTGLKLFDYILERFQEIDK